MTRYLKRGISLGLALGNITKEKAKKVIKRAIAKSGINRNKAAILTKILLRETLIEQKRIRKALQLEAKAELKKALAASKREVERLRKELNKKVRQKKKKSRRR